MCCAVSDRRRRLRDLTYETVLLTAVLFGVWVITLAAVGIAEVVVGAGVALACALAAVTFRQFIGQEWRPQGRWASWLVPLSVGGPGRPGPPAVGRVAGPPPAPRGGGPDPPPAPA